MVAKVFHGANEGAFALPPGTPVSVVRATLIDAFNIPEAAVSFVNGKRVAGSYRLLGNEVVEFIFASGRKASDRSLPLTEHGNIDITGGVPEGRIHVDLPRLGPTCKRIGIESGKAIVEWTEFGRGYQKKRYPTISGVVIRQVDHARLMAALEDKTNKRQRKVARLSVLV